MFSACEDEQELLCVATAGYLGARRRALASRRVRHVTFEAGTVEFDEKGRKVIAKPLPVEYMELLRELKRRNYWASENDYLIPNRRPASVKRKERSDKVIWMTVKKVAARAGIECHVH